MSKLYLECFSGLSGDMFVAALLDLGVNEEVLKGVLSTIPVQGFEVRVSRVNKAGLDVCDFDVLLDKELENHDYDMVFLYGEKTNTHASEQEHSHEQEHNHEHEHSHEHEHEHNHEHKHEHSHEHLHAHEHRGLQEVLNIINGTQMSERAKATATRIFTILGEAEAKAHGTTLQEVHFHEVGAVDSIVDIIAAAVCMDELGVDEVILPVLYEGTGSIRCQHGILPVPVPAVANIIQANGLRLHLTDQQGELVTPTGAAIAAAVRTAGQLPESYTILGIGIGAGKRNYEKPSLVRAMLIEDQSRNHTEKDQICRLETNIDDCSGECFGYVMECLLRAGAADVSYMPIFMKKNRPAYQLNVICRPELISKMEAVIFRETTTIGIRRVMMDRTILPREQQKIQTSFGAADVKVVERNGEKHYYPEYESTAAISRETGRPFWQVYQQIERECNGD